MFSYVWLGIDNYVYLAMKTVMLMLLKILRLFISSVIFQLRFSVA